MRRQNAKSLQKGKLSFRTLWLVVHKPLPCSDANNKSLHKVSVKRKYYTLQILLKIM
jgi:hypothetical protein